MSSSKIEKIRSAVDAITFGVQYHIDAFYKAARNKVVW